jgi:NADH:ubiquinone oxidoreductase subunit E
MHSIAQLRAEFPELAVVELDCMAACDEVPAVMIEYDFYPQVTPHELIQRVRAEFTS